MSVWGNAADPEETRDVTITRTYQAPANVVFKAWSEPEQLKQWFGPEGWPLTMAEVDFRVGGRYRFAMTGPDGKQNDPFGGEYLEIVPNERLVLTDAFEAPGNDPMRWTVTFAETDGKTTMTVHILFWSKEMKDQYLGYGMMEGAASSFDQLGTLVERLAKEGAR